MAERIAAIDKARGIAIMLVVLGHCISTPLDPVNKFILSFHMPLFFILSGMTFSTKKPAGSFITYLRDKAKRLLLPQLLLGMCFYIYYSAKAFYKFGTMDGFNLIGIYKYLSAWFLLVMFFVTLLAYVFKKYAKSVIRQTLFNGLIVVMAIIVQIHPSHFNGAFASVNLVPMAWIFYMIGYYGKNFLLKPCSFKMEIICIVLLPVMVAISQINEPVKMFASQYGNIVLFLTTATITSALVVKLAQMLDSELIEWLGGVSIIIYVWQFPVHMLFYDVVIVSMRYIGYEGAVVQYSLTFFLTLITLILLTKISSRISILRVIFSIK